MNLNNIKSKVAKILRENPDTRNNDKLLTTNYWLENETHLIRTAKDGERYINLDNILKATSEASLGRMRRKIQEPSKKWPNGRYLPTSEEVRIKRKINEECWRAWSQAEHSAYQLKF